MYKVVQKVIRLILILEWYGLQTAQKFRQTSKMPQQKYSANAPRST